MILLAAVPVIAQPCEQPRPATPAADDNGAANRCAVDDDCGLMPSVLTCCGECPPAPPFEAVPRTAIDAALLELETTCSARTLACVETPACDSVPVGCEARAVCDHGRCRLIEEGCLPLARRSRDPDACVGSRRSSSPGPRDGRTERGA